MWGKRKNRNDDCSPASLGEDTSASASASASADSSAKINEDDLTEEELAHRLIDESKAPEELRKTAISMVTAALAARQLDGVERINQFSQDLTMIFEDVNAVDSIVLNSFLADFSSALIIMIAEMTDISPDEAMRVLANVVYTSPTSPPETE